MMTLDTYLASDGAKSLTALAAEIAISKGRLSQLRHSIDWPPDLALKVESATSGAINASSISKIIAAAREAPAQDAAA
ncbi:hypothetical protein GG804_27035 [Sphingomonas histidinilytica]|uniref:hypothetical protein n=1 Tax=Rhizorhabdus histidinilytica TaxID=439228 RepID=UPI001ADADB9F|nr:hypothetical protein [Rhizorhabdus histidinilytica]MBO9380423.1 hypothetical protein [Rhizorhabdus histidinilytica]